MNLNKDVIRKIRGLIVFTIVILVALWRWESVVSILGFLVDIISPFILGASIAFVLNVPMHFFETRLFPDARKQRSKAVQKMARPVSLVLTILLVLGIIVTVFVVVVPRLAETVVTLANTIQRAFPQMMTSLEDLLANFQGVEEWLARLELDWRQLFNGIVDFFKTGASNLMGSAFSVARNVVSGVASFFIAFAFACYILVQKNRLHVQLKKVMYAYFPEKRVKKAMEIFALTYQTFASFLAGQCVEAVILGCMFLVTMSIAQMPYALLISVLIAFTALIPIFGAFIGCFVGALLILLESPVQALIFVVMFLVLQQIEGNLVYPKVVGNSVGLPSIWVLAAVAIGGSLMGVVGMLIFIPLASVLYTLFRANVYKNLKKKDIEIRPLRPEEEMSGNVLRPEDTAVWEMPGGDDEEPKAETKRADAGAPEAKTKKADPETEDPKTENQKEDKGEES